MSQKTPTYLDAQLADKIQHEDAANAKRVINVDTLVNAYWNRVELTKNNQGGVTSADFYLDKEFQITKILTISDISGSLNSKYILINSALNKLKFYIWLNVDGGGTDPMISGRTGIEVQISSEDSAEVIAVAIRIYVNSLAGIYFTAVSSGNTVTITNKVLGATDPTVDANTGFTISTDVLGVSTLLLSKTFEEVKGFKYIYNEASKAFSLISNCLNTDLGNSTDVPLADGEIFYGPWTRRTCPEILVAPYADTNFQLYVQFANTELSTTIGVLSYNAGTAAEIDSSLLFEYEAGVTLGTPRRLIFGREYYRIVVRNNSGSDMTALRVQTSLGDFDKLEVRLSSSLPLDSDALVVRSVQTGLSPNDEYVNERASGYNEAFTITTPILNGQSIVSDIQDLSGYAYILNELACDVPLVLQGTWYDDLAGTNVIRTFTFPYAGGDLSLTGTTMLSQFLRYTITNNSGSDATYTRIKVRTTNTSFQGQLLPVEAFVPPNSVANIVRSVGVGKSPDGTYENIRAQGLHSGNTTNIPLDANGVYRGDWFPIQENYIKSITSLSADTSGVLYLDVTNVDTPVDGVDDDVQGFLTFAYDPIINPILRLQSPVQTRWVRHRYINGPAAQSLFNLEGAFVVSDPGLSSQPLRVLPDNVTQVGIVRSVNTIPSLVTGEYQEIPIDSSVGNPTVTVTNVRDDLLLRPASLAQANQIVVGTAPTRIDPSPLTNRREVVISNEGPTSCSVGFGSNITYNSNSVRLSSGASRTMSLASSVELWAIAQDSGGVETTLARSGSSASGTVTSPSNALVSDDVRATMSSTAQTLSISGYTPGTTNDLVSVKIGLEVRKQSGQTETINYIDTVTGTAGNVGFVSSGSVTSNVDHTYLVAISRRNAASSITGVSGLGLTWVPILDATGNSDQTKISLWRGVGTPTGNGVVTASFTELAINSVISVSRFSNVDIDNPIYSFESLESISSTSSYSDSIDGLDNGMLATFVSMRQRLHTAGSGATEQNETRTGTGTNDASLAVNTLSLPSTGSVGYSGTLDGNVGWSVIAVTLNPREALNPQIQLSYELSAISGVTTEIIEVSSTSDTNYLLDITPDRSWVAADINNLTVIAIGDMLSAAVAEIDYLYVEIMDTTGNTTRLSLLQVGEPLT